MGRGEEGGAGAAGPGTTGTGSTGTGAATPGGAAGPRSISRWADVGSRQQLVCIRVVLLRSYCVKFPNNKRFTEN